MSKTPFDPPTPADIRARTEQIINSDTFSHLFGRWLDESEYEDIAEYGQVIAKKFGCNIIRCKKSPFGFVISWPTFPGAQYEVQHTRNSARWRRIR